MSSYRMKYKIGATQYNIPVVDDMAGFGSGIPLGTILPYSANTLNPPEGFLFCDGSAISRSMFPDLFALIGTLYGEGDGSTTFNLPDFIGKFPEGALTAGASKSAGLPNITGKFTARTYNSDATATGAFTRSNNQWAAATSTSYEGPYLVEFDASRCSAVYGNSQTVQPSSVTVRYIIKAFSATTSESALIDITNYAQALNGKPSKSLNDLSQAGEDHFYENDFTILYPNGTAANPASISLNTRVVVNNPFPGYLVYCVAEIYRNSMWGITGFVYDGGGRGILASQYDDDSIVVQSGDTYVVTGPSNTAGNPYGTGNGTGLTSAPYRVKVWKIGKIPQSS